MLYSRAGSERKLIIGVNLNDRVVHIDAQRKHLRGLVGDRPDSQLANLGPVVD